MIDASDMVTQHEKMPEQRSMAGPEHTQADAEKVAIIFQEVPKEQP